MVSLILVLKVKFTVLDRGLEHGVLVNIPVFNEIISCAVYTTSVDELTVPLTGLPVVLKFLKFHRCPEIVLKFYSFGQNVMKLTFVMLS